VGVILPSETSLSGLQIEIQVLNDIANDRVVLRKQKVLLLAPINYFHSASLQKGIEVAGKTAGYLVAGTGAIGITIGSPYMLSSLKLLSFIEVMVYFNVRFPASVELLFSTFFSTSDASFLANLILGKQSATSVERECTLPGVLRERGKSTCSFIRSQFTLILFLLAIVFIRLMIFFFLRISRRRFQRFTSWAEKLQRVVGVQYVYNYVDACAFKILLDASVTLLYGNLGQTTQRLAISLLEKAIASFFIMFILTLIAASTYSIAKLTKMSPDSSSTPLDPHSWPPSTASQSIISTFKFCTDSSTLIRGRLGQYLLPSLQLKALFCAVIISSLQYYPLIHISLTCGIQICVLVLCVKRESLKVKREWVVALIVHVGLLVCYLLSLPLYNPSLLSPRSIYFYIGLPITLSILIIFIFNIYNSVHAIVLKLRDRVPTKTIEPTSNAIYPLEYKHNGNIRNSINKSIPVKTVEYLGKKKIKFRRIRDAKSPLNQEVKDPSDSRALSPLRHGS